MGLAGLLGLLGFVDPCLGVNLAGHGILLAYSTFIVGAIARMVSALPASNCF